MSRVLVTGMSATGKSSVLAELARRGHRVVNTDDDGWSEDVTGPEGTEQLWLEEPMSELLAEDVPGNLFVGGCVSNQGKFYEQFDAVVLLSVPVDVMLQRLASRGTNDFGKDPEERQRILRDVALVEPLLRATSTGEVDGTRPLQEVADEVEAYARGGHPGPGELSRPSAER